MKFDIVSSLPYISVFLKKQIEMPAVIMTFMMTSGFYSPSTKYGVYASFKNFNNFEMKHINLIMFSEK